MENGLDLDVIDLELDFTSFLLYNLIYIQGYAEYKHNYI